MSARRLLGDRRGSVAIMIALAALPLMLAMGVAVDGMRAWLVRSRLVTAIDAAALAGGRNLNLAAATRDAEVQGMFWTNFQKTGVDPADPTRWLGFMGASAPQPSICARPSCVDVDSNTIRVSNTARLPTTFMRLSKAFGGPDLDTVTLRWTSDSRRADLGMELALVLDVTGSMGSNQTPSAFGSASNNGTNIDALRLAAGDLISILYGSNESLGNLWVSVVPYTTTVNIGTGNSSWLAAGQRDFGRFAPRSWLGCVEARHLGGNDQNDATPTAAPFNAFFNASTLGKYTVTATGAAVPGDNDWAASLTGSNAITEQYQDVRENYNAGPNTACPATPILPLTASKTTVLNTIAAVRSTFKGGTMHNVGLQAGWFTLSPNWRGLWGNPALPLAYGTQFMQKVVVLMTDGVANWNDWNGGAPGTCSETTVTTTAKPAGTPALHPLACPANGTTTTTYPRNTSAAAGAPPLNDGTASLNPNGDYSGYGRPLENRLAIATPLTIARMTTQLNTRMTNLCAAMKQQGILIYTITFNLTDSTTQALFRSCASSAERYFNSPDQATLRSAFQQIGTQLANLRLLR
jgi:hypothetical protein